MVVAPPAEHDRPAPDSSGLFSVALIQARSYQPLLRLPITTTRIIDDGFDLEGEQK
jgi:hypothetical protein